MKRMGVISICSLVVLMLISSGYYYIFKYDEEESEENKETPYIYDQPVTGVNFTTDNYPKVDGSTSTHPLDVLIACKILNVTYRWEQWFDGTRRIYANQSEVEKIEVVKYINNNIEHNGTHGSYVNLINRSADIILAAREPSDDELDLARNNSVGLKIRTIALDAFVFIMNVNNSVNDLSVEEIRGIYTGEIRNWKEVGGKEETINAYRRNRNSGSEELMKSLVMKNLTMIGDEYYNDTNYPQGYPWSHPYDLILFGMMGPINRLEYDEQGIGYSVYFFKEFMAPNEKIKLCGVNGILPSYENIQTRKYIYTTEVHAAIREDQNVNSEAYRLWEWLLSEEGQCIVRESGYVPVHKGL